MTSEAIGAGLPSWPGRIRLMRRSSELVSLAALAADAVASCAQGAPLGVYVALLISAAGVWTSRTRPAAGLGVVVAGLAVMAGVGWEPAAAWTVVVFILFSATLAGVRALPAGLIVGAVLYVLVAAAARQWPLTPAAIVAALGAVAAAGAGGAVRAQWRYLTVVQERAADTLRARHTEAELEVDRERLRLARELHDSVGHEVAALNVHLGVAEVSLPDGAEATRAALGQARGSVQAILRETQDILRVLRRGLRSDDPLPLPPLAARLPELVESFRSMGLDVTSRYDADALQRLDPPLAASVYRIIEEGLTNTQRHGTGSAALSVRHEGDQVVIEVENPVPEDQAASPGSGLGLVGIAERAESLGGRVRAERAAGVHRLRVWLPVRGRVGE